MIYYNEGTFTTKTMEDMSQLVEILNLHGLDPNGFSPDDACELLTGQFCLELNNCNGDIEQQIDKIVEACQKKHLDVNFEIHYYGDAEGAYLFHNGVYECLGEEEYHAHQMDEKVLLKEIYHRGLNLVELPYKVGAILTAKTDGIKHYDQVDHYIINESGIQVVLNLDYNTCPRLSQPISLNKLSQKWSPAKIQKKITFSPKIFHSNFT